MCAPGHIFLWEQGWQEGEAREVPGPVREGQP